MRIALLLLMLLLSGCSTFGPQPMENDEIIFRPPSDAEPEGYFATKWRQGEPPMTAARMEELRIKYLVDPFYSDDERRWVRLACGALAADAITTILGLGNGCSEANPLYGSNEIARYAVPVVAGATCAWLWHGARRSPRVHDLTPQLKFVAGVRSGAATWNLWTGCVLK